MATLKTRLKSFESNLKKTSFFRSHIQFNKEKDLTKTKDKQNIIKKCYSKFVFKLLFTFFL